MTSKRFVTISLSLTTLLILSMIGFNLYMNEFGLYGDVKGKEIRIWTYNRASKYLLSLNYIPTNFDGILIGSSSSATMMDTRKIKGAKIYNLSMNGANICEVAPAAINALELGQMKYLIVCLDPYLTKNSMMKTSELSTNLEKSIYGSLFNIRFYLYKLKYTLFPESDPYRESWWGHRIYLTDNDGPVDIQHPTTIRQPFKIDPNALECLKQVIDTARKKRAAIYAYYHPKKHDDFLKNIDNYRKFKIQMNTLFTPKDVVWDFNIPEFLNITENQAAFYDNAHLTEKGAGVVLKEIENKIFEHQ